MLIQPILTGSSSRDTSTTHPGAGRFRPGLHHPGRLVVGGFALAVAGRNGAADPARRQGGSGRRGPTSRRCSPRRRRSASPASSVVDTATYWSGFGQVVILVLIQVGGFGIMTLASLLGLLISRRLGLRTRLLAAAETKTLSLGDVRRCCSASPAQPGVEAVTALVLALRFAVGYDEPLGAQPVARRLPLVSAFNNAGFALYSDSLIGFADRPVDLPAHRRRRHHRRPGLPGHPRAPAPPPTARPVERAHQDHAARTAVLLVGGTVFMLVAEWSNPGTLGRSNAPGKLLAGFFQGVMPRTAGFNSVDIGAMNTGTLLGTDVLMFIGGGSAGTAGGIKVDHLLRAAPRHRVGGARRPRRHRLRPADPARRHPAAGAHRRPARVAAVVGPDPPLRMTTPFTLDQILYEVVSAFATVGLSTGITADLPRLHQLVLVGAHVHRPPRARHPRHRAGPARAPAPVPAPGGRPLIG